MTSKFWNMLLHLNFEEKNISKLTNVTESMWLTNIKTAQLAKSVI